MSRLAAIVVCALGALSACSVGDFPLRRDAGSAGDAPSDVPRTDVPVTPDVPTDQPVVTDQPTPTDTADGGACAGNRRMCGAACVDMDTDARNCGACGHDCTSLPHVRGTVACLGGHCQLAAACADGFAHCTTREDDGCEADITTPSRCGACGVTCMEPTPRCQVVTAGPSMDGGVDAGADASVDGGSDAGGASARYVCTSGCEPLARCGGACVDTQTSLVHCGACGTACPAVLNGSPACTTGSCRFTCTPGFADCDAVPSTGCEVDTRTSVDHCGMCRNACPARPNATATCAGGMCGLNCNPGFADCDRVATNGCEADLRSSPTQCGMCGMACPSGPNSVPVCRSSVCAIQCAVGFADCDGDASNGCEVNIRTSATNCGACRVVCPGGPNGTPVCTAGTCGIVCRAPYGNCDSFDGNGCETDLTSSPTHCGLCETSCPVPANTTATCTAGTCGTTCASTRYGDCDSNRANGCETDLWAQGNCGCCGRTCGMSCFMGVCIPDGACR